MSIPFESRRSDVLARNGAVATSQPLAAQMGLRALQDGGNAIDAAVQAAATLCVVEPMSTGVGGDLFALIWMEDQKRLFALNGSGKSAMAANMEDVRKLGLSALPVSGGANAALAVSVPGQVAAWEDLLQKFGTMPLKTVLQPAIEYATNGFAVSEWIAKSWQSATPKLKFRPSGGELLVEGGRAPAAGEIVTLPTLAKTLNTIAAGGADAFYNGSVAQQIEQFVQAEGGWLNRQDLAQHRSEWVEPISTNYRGVDVWQCPPNGQGIITLLALNILENFDVTAAGRQSAQRYHWLIEATKLAFEDGLATIADPDFAPLPLNLIDKSYAKRKHAEIGDTASGGKARHGELGNDTVYVTAIDGAGNACSLISSLFYGFGTGLVVPQTGIALQSRGALFSLDENHPNHLQGGKRPYQTIIPAMATSGGELLLSFGVMGGYQQPQGQLQVISNMLDFGLSPQQALDELRYSVDVVGDGTVHLEQGLANQTSAELQQRGHNTNTVSGYGRVLFGGGQIIRRDKNTGVLTAGSEPRKDGCAVGW